MFTGGSRLHGNFLLARFDDFDFLLKVFCELFPCLVFVFQDKAMFQLIPFSRPMTPTIGFVSTCLAMGSNPGDLGPEAFAEEEGLSFICIKVCVERGEVVAMDGSHALFLLKVESSTSSGCILVDGCLLKAKRIKMVWRNDGQMSTHGLSGFALALGCESLPPPKQTLGAPSKIRIRLRL